MAIEPISASPLNTRTHFCVSSAAVRYTRVAGLARAGALLHHVLDAEPFGPLELLHVDQHRARHVLAAGGRVQPTKAPEQIPNSTTRPKPCAASHAAAAVTSRRRWLP